MYALRKVAQETIIERWATMTEWERDAWTVYLAIVTRHFSWRAIFADTEMRIILIVFLLALIALIALAMGMDDPSPLLLSGGFALGVIFVMAVIFAILKGVKNGHNGK